MDGIAISYICAVQFFPAVAISLKPASHMRYFNTDSMDSRKKVLAVNQVVKPGTGTQTRRYPEPKWRGWKLEMVVIGWRIGPNSTP